MDNGQVDYRYDDEAYEDSELIEEYHGGNGNGRYGGGQNGYYYEDDQQLNQGQGNYVLEDVGDEHCYVDELVEYDDVYHNGNVYDNQGSAYDQQQGYAQETGGDPGVYFADESGAEMNFVEGQEYEEVDEDGNVIGYYIHHNGPANQEYDESQFLEEIHEPEQQYAEHGNNNYPEDDSAAAPMMQTRIASFLRPLSASNNKVSPAPSDNSNNSNNNSSKNNNHDNSTNHNTNANKNSKSRKNSKENNNIYGDNNYDNDPKNIKYNSKKKDSKSRHNSAGEIKPASLSVLETSPLPSNVSSPSRTRERKEYVEPQPVSPSHEITINSKSGNNSDPSVSNINDSGTDSNHSNGGVVSVSQVNATSENSGEKNFYVGGRKSPGKVQQQQQQQQQQGRKAGANRLSNVAAAPQAGVSEHVGISVKNRMFMGYKKTPTFLNALVFSGGNNPQVIIASADSTVRIHDAFTGEATSTLTGHTDRVLCVAVSIRGDVFFGGKTVEPLVKLGSKDDGAHYIVTGGRDENLCIWDYYSFRCLHTIHAHKAPIWAVEVVNVGDVGYVITASDAGGIRIWEAATGKKLMNLKGQKGKVFSLAIMDRFHPEPILLSGGEDKTIHVWDLLTGRHLKLLEGHEDDVTCLAANQFKPSAAIQLVTKTLVKGASKLVSLVISGSRDKTVRVWDFTEGHALFVFEGHSGTIYGLSVALTVKPSLRCTAMTPLVISGSEDGSVIMWSLDTGKALKEVKGHVNSVKGLACTVAAVGPEREMVAATCGWDKSLHMFDIDDILAVEDAACKCVIS